MTKNQCAVFIINFLTIGLLFAASTPTLLPFHLDLHDRPKLQRGAKVFMNYCSGCHSLRYLRYNRLANDLGLSTFDGRVDENLLYNNLIFTTAKLADPVQIAMPPEDARQWFGVLPPDLSLVARERGPHWLFTYLKSFYADKNRPFGTNNLLVPGAAMPNVLEPLIGKVVLATSASSGALPTSSQLTLLQPGEMSPQEFDSNLEDLITFLVYVGEPARLVRYRLGSAVLIFLSILLLCAWRLKKNYWKNIS